MATNALLCAQCAEPMAWLGGESSTLVGYLSPPGHCHDDNCVTRIYRCRNGHEQRMSVRNSCHACDWRGKATCFCHPGAKLDAWPEPAAG